MKNHNFNQPQREQTNLTSGEVAAFADIVANYDNNDRPLSLEEAADFAEIEANYNNEEQKEDAFKIGESVSVMRNARDGDPAHMEEGWAVTGRNEDGSFRVNKLGSLNGKEGLLTKDVTEADLKAWQLPPEGQPVGGHHEAADGHGNFADLAKKIGNEYTQEEAVISQTDRVRRAFTDIKAEIGDTYAAKTIDKEAAHERPKSLLRRVGRAATSGMIGFIKARVGSFFESGNKKFDEFLKAGEQRFTPKPDVNTDSPDDSAVEAPAETTTDNDEVDIDDSEDNPDDYYLSKRYSKNIDRLGAVIDNKKEGSLRYKTADKLFAHAKKVEDRDGNYLTRAAEKSRKLEKWADDHEGVLGDKIREKAAAAREKRTGRIKKQRLRTAGRKLLTYHQAGVQAANNVKRPDQAPKGE